MSRGGPGPAGPPPVAATQCSQISRRVTAYRCSRLSSRRSERAAMAPEARWTSTIVSRSSEPLVSSARVSASRSSSESTVLARPDRRGVSGSGVRPSSASIAAVAASAGPSWPLIAIVPIRTLGRTSSIGSSSSVATAAASSSASGRTPRIAVQRSSVRSIRILERRVSHQCGEVARFLQREATRFGHGDSGNRGDRPLCATRCADAATHDPLICMVQTREPAPRSIRLVIWERTAASQVTTRLTPHGPGSARAVSFCHSADKMT